MSPKVKCVGSVALGLLIYHFLLEFNSNIYSLTQFLYDIQAFKYEGLEILHVAAPSGVLK